MPITELVLPQLVDDAARRQQLFEEFPSIAQKHIAGAQGLRVGFRAKILEAYGPLAEGHGGFIPVLAWEKLENFQTFVQSPAFATFKETITPYITAPPNLQVFQSTNTSEGLLTGSSHLQAFIFSSADGTKPEAEKIWSRFVESVKSAAPAQAEPQFNHGFGARDSDGTLLGLVGWKDLSVLKDVNSDPKVKQALEDLKTSFGADNLSSLTVELFQTI